MKRRSESGQAVLLVVVAVGLVLLGSLGLAIDTGQMYGYRQMAQAGADASALAAATAILANTNTGTNAFGDAAFTCSVGTDVRTPCAYARLHGFAKMGSTDTIAVDFPSTVTGVTLSPTVTPAAVRVIITRPVGNTFMRLLGAGASSNVKALAIAAIVQTTTPVPILVLHPTLDASFEIQGTPAVTICGGPQLSVQVNSRSTTAASGGGTAQLDPSRGGPTDTAGTCSGTGSDLGVFGGPSTTPSWFTPVGTNTHYIQPSLPMSDPYALVDPPGVGSNGWTPPRTCSNNNGDGCKSPLADGVGGCPATPKRPCQLWLPGEYTDGIDVQNQTVVFSPGVYKITGGTAGFQNGANGDMHMCNNCAADTSTGGTGNTGMLVYIGASNGTFNVGANSDVFLSGSSADGTYKGMLFFKDRGNTAQIDHFLGGNGNISLSGTIYATNTIAAMRTTPAVYQRVRLQGGSGSTTTIRGDIVTSVLRLGGNSAIRMELPPNLLLPVNHVALVK